MTSRIDRVARIELTSAYGDLTLRNVVSFDRATKAKTASVVLSRGSAPIANLDAEFGPGGEVRATVLYGQGVQGVSAVHVSSRDGGAYEGDVDGRAFTADRPRSVEALRFADGGPAPRLMVEPGLREQVSALAAQMRSSRSQCRTAAGAWPVRQSVPIRQNPYPPQGPSLPPTAGGLRPRQYAPEPYPPQQPPASRWQDNRRAPPPPAQTSSASSPPAPYARHMESPAASQPPAPYARHLESAPSPPPVQYGRHFPSTPPQPAAASAAGQTRPDRFRPGPYSRQEPGAVQPGYSRQVLDQSGSISGQAMSGGNWYPAGDDLGDEGGRCSSCHNTCGNECETCWGQAAIDAIFGCAPCVGVAVATCDAEAAGCVEVCYAPGNACCPVGCGATLQSRDGIIAYANCCGAFDTCISQANGGICCPQGHLVCGSNCCDASTTTCAPDGGCGCAGGLEACGSGVCCAAGEVCCGDTCCAAGQCRNGQCCANFCGDTCCPPFNACCNGVCCPDTFVCAGGVCCPPAQACGATCCANGANCLDARTGQCGAPFTCRDGFVACVSQVGAGYTKVCCPRPMERLGVTSAVTCCNGVCCQPGQVCCNNYQSGQTMCSDPGQCLNPR